MGSRLRVEALKNGGVTNVRTWRNFYELVWIARSPNAPQRNSFAFGVKEGSAGGGRKQGCLGHCSQRAPCLPGSPLRASQTRRNLDAQEQWPGLASGKQKPSLKESRAWGVAAHMTSPGKNLRFSATPMSVHTSDMPLSRGRGGEERILFLLPPHTPETPCGYACVCVCVCVPHG